MTLSSYRPTVKADNKFQSILHVVLDVQKGGKKHDYVMNGCYNSE